MAVIIKSHNRDTSIDSIIGMNINTGKVLQGERDMYERIVHDCEASQTLWYMWYDLTFHIPYAGQNEIQIDFLLLCKEGAIVVEVKGGTIELYNGHYYYLYKGNLVEMKRSPFDQAHSYQWALINNGIFNKKVTFVDHVCAFPHSKLNRTSNNPINDLSYKLWNKTKQDSNESFAEFCLNVLQQDKRSNLCMTSEELEEVVESIMPSIEDRNKYSLTSLREILQWLHIDNLSILEGLSRNNRIVIEGGPGTGKTTMAKAFIKRHNRLKGLYICWTALLAIKVRLDLEKEGLLSCEVKTYNNYIKEITSPQFDIEQQYSNQDFLYQLRIALMNSQKSFYDYVIVDEAQDIADKGIDVMLDMFKGPDYNGLRYGRFLVFYDTEQGYNSKSRQIDDTISIMSEYSALYVLDENKRVPTNKLIVEYANKVLEVKHTQEGFEEYLKTLNEKDIPGLTISYFKTVSKLKVAIKEHAHLFRDYCNEMTSTVLLVHSDLKYKDDPLDDSVYELISELEVLLYPLTEYNMENKPTEKIAFTSVLKYKGLEDNNIILVLPKSKMKSSWENFLFEIYVGMTRAIMNLDILILE